MSQIFVRESFLIGPMLVPNFMKIEMGLVDLAWNDTHVSIY